MLHKTHTGIVITKALARSYVWWPHLNEDIESLVSGCTKCLEHRHMPPKTSHEWIMPTRPWSRIHIDFAGPFHNKFFLILVDAYSRWPELFMVNNTTSATVIRLLRTVFATHGLCETLVSDNGTSFVSNEMKQFLSSNNIRHVTTAPYHPATNGLAERMVQTIKDKLRKMDDLAWEVRIPNLLLGLRATPCITTNKTPAELLMKRKLRTLLDTIHPDNIQHKKVENQIRENSQKKTRETNVGQNVMYRNYSNIGPRWLPGKVINKQGPLNYKVESKDGTVVNRHIDQLIKTTGAQSRPEKREGTDTIPTPEETIPLDLDELFGNGDENMRQDSQEDERIIEIPDADQWADMLGIPTSATNQGATGKIRNKLTEHTKTPYQRPHDSKDNLYIC